MPMTLIARPWLIAVLLGLLALSPAHAGMTPKEMIWFKDFSVMAEKGEAEGQSGLGICYTRGHGVAKDDVQAAAWFRKAADQGVANAQFNLGWMYGTGQGVPQDAVSAYMWFTLSAARSTGKTPPTRAARNRDAVAKTMTPTQIESGQTSSREWLAAFAKRGGK